MACSIDVGKADMTCTVIYLDVGWITGGMAH